MEQNFGYFKSAIPKDMYDRTKSHICSHVAIFVPEEYRLGEPICVDDYHFLLFFAESPKMTVAGRPYSPRKGDLLVIRPFEPVIGFPDEGKKYGKYMNISVKKDFFQKIAAESARGEDFAFGRLQGRYSAQLLDLVGSFQREIMDFGEAYPLMVESICTQLVFQLIRDLQGAPACRAVKENQYIRAAIELMESHYASNISINDICSLIYLSPCHFKRVFKEHTGKSPYQYLMRLRIEKSRELLKNTRYSVEEVARRCGFVNAGHFATVFKRFFNLSPTEFRKRAER